MGRKGSALLLLIIGLPVAQPQSLTDFTTPLPLRPGDALILGFLGGFESWDDENRGVRRLALALREKHLPGIYVETLSNHKRSLGLQLIRKALDSDTDGLLSDSERTAHRIILYGQSFGGAAAVKTARELEALGIPVHLTVQVDSVGRDDQVIPSNVAAAANFYQSHRFTIRGERQIYAADPSRTRIIENRQLHYSQRDGDKRPESWLRRHFGGAHARMEADPALWSRIQNLILQSITTPAELQ